MNQRTIPQLIKECKGRMMMKLGYQINQSKHVLITLFLVIATLFSVACVPAITAVASKETPTITTLVAPTSTPEPTPTPTPTPEPTPTPMPELTLEEERALLGVADEDEPVELATIMVMLYTQKDEKGNDITRISWFTEAMNSRSERALYNRFRREKMFIVTSSSHVVKEYLNTMVPANKRLQGSKILDTCGIWGVQDFYKVNGIEYDLPKEAQKTLSLGISNDGKLNISMLDFMDLYIKCTPKQYRTSWKDFDESLTFGESPQP